MSDRDVNATVVAVGALSETLAPKRVRSAYVCFWAKQEARDKLDELAAARSVSRSEMARIIFGAGIAALGAGR